MENRKPQILNLLVFTLVVGIVISPAALRSAEYIAYDASGNIVARRIDSKTVRMNYDAGNRLVNIIEPNRAAEFSYDASGAMVSEKQGGEDVAFEYRYGSRLSRRVENGESVEVFYDHRGFPVAKRSQGKVVPWLWEGSDIVLIGDSPQQPELANVDFLGTDLDRSESLFGSTDSGVYTGKHIDAELKAYVFPYRFYRPDLLRWNVPDPAGYPDGINAYAYLSNPNTSKDPLGLWEIDYPATAEGAAPILWNGNNPVFGATTTPASATLNGTYGMVESRPVDENDENSCYCAGFPMSTREGSLTVPYRYSSPEFIVDSAWYVTESQQATISHELEHVSLSDIVGRKTYEWFEFKVREMYTDEFQDQGNAEMAAVQDRTDMFSAMISTYQNNYSTIQRIGHPSSSTVPYTHPLGGPTVRFQAGTSWSSQAMTAALAISVGWGPIEGDCEN